MRTEIRVRHLPRLLYGSPRLTDRCDFQKLVAATGRFYSAVRTVTGAGLIVDSSKSPAFAALLLHVPSVDLRIVHVVRDPRGVVDSWSRKKQWTSGAWQEEMRIRSTGSALAGWVGMNLGAEAVCRAYGAARVPRVRIEDFVSAPITTLQEALQVADLDIDARALPVAAGSLDIQPNHALAGNVDRFQVGSVMLRSTDDWRSHLSRRRQRAIFCTTAPVMLRYGYRM